jgi:hypothetical protein
MRKHGRAVPLPHFNTYRTRERCPVCEQMGITSNLLENGKSRYCERLPFHYTVKHGNQPINHQLHRA